MKLTVLNKKLLMACGVYEEVADLIMERITKLEEDEARLNWLQTNYTVFALNWPTLQGQPIRTRIDAERKEIP